MHDQSDDCNGKEEIWIKTPPLKNWLNMYLALLEKSIPHLYYGAYSVDTAEVTVAQDFSFGLLP